MDDPGLFPDLLPSLLPLCVKYESLMAHNLLRSATDSYMMDNDSKNNNVIGNFCDIFNHL